MLKLRLFFNKYKQLIFISVFIFVLMLLILQFLNNKVLEESEVLKNSSSIIDATTVTNNYSVISGKRIEKEEAVEINKIIDKFLKYCNEKEFEKAYMLLSSDCKNELFPNYNTFVNEYAGLIFDTQKIYDSQAWVNDDDIIYKITLTDDSLSTGKIMSDKIEDYFTVVSENEEYRLNINNYIGKREINHTVEEENIKITVISKKVYMDYEKYLVKVENKSNKPILLDGFRNSKSMYLTDKKSNKKVALLNETLESELLVQKNLTITKEIRFNKIYSDDIISCEIHFDDIILDYYDYNNLDDKTEYTNNLSVKIDL